MINKTEQIISKSEIEKFRTPTEFISWIDSKLELFRKHRKQIKEQELLRKGISKQFWGEIYPLYLFFKKQTLLGQNFKVKNIIGNQSYDAEIQYLTKNTNLIFKLEFTEAKDGYDSSLRMEKFIEANSVSLTGKLNVTGTKKTGHKISISEDMVEHKNYLDAQLKLVRECVEKKKKKKYSSDTALVVVIDDYIAPRYDNAKDLNYFNDFLNSDNIFKDTEFAALFFVGMSGGLFFEKIIR